MVALSSVQIIAFTDDVALIARNKRSLEKSKRQIKKQNIYLIRDSSKIKYL